MHGSICRFPSTALYHSKLTSHPSVAAHLLRDLPNLDAEGCEADVLDVPVIFFDTDGCEYFERVGGGDDDEGKGRGRGDEEGSRRNENEAGVVKAWVEKLVRCQIFLAPTSQRNRCLEHLHFGYQVEAGLQPSQIAVITPYVFQNVLTLSQPGPVQAEPSPPSPLAFRYQAQVTALTSLLRPTMPDLEIGSVDGMQGREKEAVVLSLVRSNDKVRFGLFTL